MTRWETVLMTLAGGITSSPRLANHLCVPHDIPLSRRTTTTSEVVSQSSSWWSGGRLVDGHVSERTIYRNAVSLPFPSGPELTKTGLVRKRNLQRWLLKRLSSLVLTLFKEERLISSMARCPSHQRLVSTPNYLCPSCRPYSRDSGSTGGIKDEYDNELVTRYHEA